MHFSFYYLCIIKNVSFLPLLIKKTKLKYYRNIIVSEAWECCWPDLVYSNEIFLIIICEFIQHSTKAGLIQQMSGKIYYPFQLCDFPGLLQDCLMGSSLDQTYKETVSLVSKLTVPQPFWAQSNTPERPQKMRLWFSSMEDFSLGRE